MKTLEAFSVIVKLREGSCPALLLTAPLWPRCSAACVCLRHYLATEMLITIAADLFLPLLRCLLLLLPDPDPDQQLCSIYSLVPGDYQLMWVIMSIMTSGCWADQLVCHSCELSVSEYLTVKLFKLFWCQTSGQQRLGTKMYNQGAVRTLFMTQRL